MRRFSETSRFDEDWYCSLPLEMKAAWELLWAKADACGVWKINHKLAEFQIGKKVDWAEFLKRSKGRVIQLDSDRYLFVQFVKVNCGSLSRECKAHNHVFTALESNGLSPEQAASGSYSISYSVATEKHIYIEEEKEKDKDVREGMQGEGTTEPKDEAVILNHLNRTAARDYRPTETNLSLIRARLGEDGVTLDGCLTMIERQVKLWKGRDMEEYLRPSTLFGKEKFSGYYGARSSPLPNGAGKPRNGALPGEDFTHLLAPEDR